MASNKLPVAEDIISTYFKPGQRWIVYCDSLNQLDGMLRILRRLSLPVMEYHYQMGGDRHQTLKHFEAVGGIIVAIRCLDEGVDIPAVSHALILASSKNPREFIQRRGRVLRRYKGKSLSFIHDLLVVPKLLDGEGEKGDPIVRGELARAIEFGQSAQNPSAIIELQRIAQRFGININIERDEGVEDEKH